ncbi:TetR/AcrR family transcriptional regulator [Kutzneria viridogrisea]
MPMSTPLRRRGPSKGDLKQEAILETAERLLAVKALAEIGIGELAAGAGISRSSFYFYFESKQALLSALLDKAADALLADVDTWLEPSTGEPGHEIGQSVEVAVRMWREHGAVLLAAQNPDSPPEAREFTAGLTARLIEASAAVIRHKREEGQAPDGPPSAEALATMLIGMTEHCIARHFTSPSLVRDDRELIDTLTAVWTRSIFAADLPR